jgi:hypothetical protein
MKAHTFTDTRILNNHGCKSHWGCICVCGCWCGFFLFLCLLNALFQIMQVSMLPRTHQFQYGSMLLFQRSAVTTCQVRKCTTFIEYVQCMFEDLETCLHVDHWLAINDFNYNDDFMHTLCELGLISSLA